MSEDYEDLSETDIWSMIAESGMRCIMNVEGNARIPLAHVTYRNKRERNKHLFPSRYVDLGLIANSQLSFPWMQHDDQRKAMPLIIPEYF